MRHLRVLFCLGLSVVALAATPGMAAADEWQKKDGYWYYWSDNAQRWYYQDGDAWLVYQNGAWVRTASYQSYYAAPAGYVNFPYGNVAWGYPNGGGFVNFPYGGVSWGGAGGSVRFPYGSVSWGGSGRR